MSSKSRAVTLGGVAVAVLSVAAYFFPPLFIAVTVVAPLVGGAVAGWLLPDRLTQCALAGLGAAAAVTGILMGMVAVLAVTIVVPEEDLGYGEQFVILYWLQILASPAYALAGGALAVGTQMLRRKFRAP